MITNPVSSEPFRIAAILPQSGPAGLFGPSCSHCFTLAVEEVNVQGGILGRPVQLATIDGGQEPARVAHELQLLISQGAAHAVVGMHDSDVRTATLPMTTRRIPYVYTPTYEGGDVASGLFCLGETPHQVVSYPIPWLARERSVGKWHFIGNDYKWPRALLSAFSESLTSVGIEGLTRDLVHFDHEDFESVLDGVVEQGAQGIFVCLVGTSSVTFNRQFLARGLERRVIRFDPLIEANTQMAIGQHAENRLFAASAYHAGSKSGKNQQFRKAYDRRFGENAPEITALAAGCYDGVHFLASLIGKAGSTELATLQEASENLVFNGVRGHSIMKRGHLTQTIHMISFKAGREVELAQFPEVSAVG